MKSTKLQWCHLRCYFRSNLRGFACLGHDLDQLDEIPTGKIWRDQLSSIGQNGFACLASKIYPQKRNFCSPVIAMRRGPTDPCPTINLDHVRPCSTLHWKNKNNSNNYTTTRTTRTTTQKQKVIITLSNKLMVVIIQTTQIMPLVRKHHHDVVASLASFDSPVGLAWDHLNLWKVLESLTLRDIESVRCRNTIWKIYRNNRITGNRLMKIREHHGTSWKKALLSPCANVKLKSWCQSRSFGLQIIKYLMPVLI